MYICIEGTEGVGKSTQSAKLTELLRDSMGVENVCATSEPGSANALLTMELRKLMLDAAWDSQMTKEAREYISQAARSVNLAQVVLPALSKKKFVIQDRGVLSGLAYGQACGHSEAWLESLADVTCSGLKKIVAQVYDVVILLVSDDPSFCLKRAKKCKTEFKAGDNIENRGDLFMKQVATFMQEQKYLKCPIVKINVTNKTIQEVHEDIIKALGMFQMWNSSILH